MILNLVYLLLLYMILNLVYLSVCIEFSILIIFHMCTRPVSMRIQSIFYAYPINLHALLWMSMRQIRVRWSLLGPESKSRTQNLKLIECRFW
jgi:hypothetical protein